MTLCPRLAYLDRNHGEEFTLYVNPVEGMSETEFRAFCKFARTATATELTLWGEHRAVLMSGGFDD